MNKKEEGVGGERWGGGGREEEEQEAEEEGREREKEEEREGGGERRDGGRKGERALHATHTALTDRWQKVKLYCVKAPEFGGRLLQHLACPDSYRKPS